MNAFTANHELAFDTEAMRSNTVPSARRADRRSGLAMVLGWIVELPRRRAVINELASLSDHELADIGLERGEVGRVFDRGFAARRRAA